MTDAFSNLTRRALVLGAAMLPLLSAPSFAQDAYPAKPVRILVPLAAASTVDIVARKLAEDLAAPMGQQFVVENRPGAGGVIGTSEIVRAEKDGYTIGMISSNHVINPSIMKSVPFDSLADIKPISVIATVPLVLVVHPSVEAKSAQDLIAMAKAQPGTVDYGSSGNGTALHLAGVLFTREAGVEMRHVPYKGTGPLTNDLVAGHVKVGFLSVAAALPQIQGGTLKALAVSTPTRNPSLPDVPTLAESGLPNYSFDAWVAMVGPAGLPQPVVDRLYTETKRLLDTQKVKDDLTAQGLVVIGSDPATAETFFRDELKKHSELVAASGTKPE